MKLLAGASGTAAAMLRFLIFTSCRTNEAVEAHWAEIDRPSSTWKIPGERMKMDQDPIPRWRSSTRCETATKAN
ncbi:integrase [Bradyrhizobium sp. LB13.1]